MVGDDDHLLPAPGEELVDALRQVADFLLAMPGNHPTVAMAVSVDLAVLRPAAAVRIADLVPFENLISGLRDQLRQVRGIDLGAGRGDEGVEAVVAGESLGNRRDGRFGGRGDGGQGGQPGADGCVVAQLPQTIGQLHAEVEAQGIDEEQTGALVRCDQWRWRIGDAVVREDDALERCGRGLEPGPIECIGGDPDGGGVVRGGVGDGGQGAQEGIVSPPALGSVGRDDLRGRAAADGLRGARGQVGERFQGLREGGLTEPRPDPAPPAAMFDPRGGTRSGARPPPAPRRARAGPRASISSARRLWAGQEERRSSAPSYSGPSSRKLICVGCAWARRAMTPGYCSGLSLYFPDGLPVPLALAELAYAGEGAVLLGTEAVDLFADSEKGLPLLRQEGGADAVRIVQPAQNGGPVPG